VSIFVGGSEIAEIKIGSTTINEVYVGSTLVWSANHRVTQGISGNSSSAAEYRGFDSSGQVSGGMGSISPSTLNGATLTSVFVWRATVKNNTAYYFTVRVSGQRAQNFFTSVNESSLGTKTTSSVQGFTSTQTVTTWTWGLTGFPTNWDGSGVLELDFV
jgi:hypothetical protein